MKGKSAAIHRGRHKGSAASRNSSPYHQSKPPSGFYGMSIRKNGFARARAR